MAAFTLYLKECIELSGGTVDIEAMSYKGLPMGGISKLTGGNIGVTHMPIFDEDYREILTGKIVDRFYNREIGHETLDMFQIRMRVKLNEIMPFYNQLYLSTQIPYEALKTIELQTVTTSQNEGTINQTTDIDSTTTSTDLTTGLNTSEQTSKSGSRAVQSTTPQTMLSENEDYASAASDTNSAQSGDSTTSNQAESEGTQEAIAENRTVGNTTGEATGDTLVSGFQGTPADLIMRFRDSLINVDVQVLNELEELFMQVWDTADSYTQRGFWL